MNTDQIWSGSILFEIKWMEILVKQALPGSYFWSLYFNDDKDVWDWFWKKKKNIYVY